MWLPDDQLYVLAFIAEEKGRCECGHQRDEAWVLPESAQADPWVAKEAVCYACEALRLRRKALSEDGGELPAVHLWVSKDG